MPLIFEGDFDFGAVGLDLAASDDHVLLDHFGDAQLPQMLGGLLDRDLGGVLPGLCAGADQLDDFSRCSGSSALSLLLALPALLEGEGVGGVDVGTEQILDLATHGRRRYGRLPAKKRAPAEASALGLRHPACPNDCNRDSQPALRRNSRSKGADDCIGDSKPFLLREL